MIRASGLSYTTRGRSIVSDVSIAIEPGELVAIVGPNGAGKTTLLRLLAGELTPTQGEVQLADSDPRAASPLALARVRAFLGADERTDVEFSVEHVVGMGRFPHGTSSIENEAIVYEAMAATDVDSLADRPISTLSTGEVQRAAVARVLAQETPILLLDEPTSSLDLGHRALVMTALADRAANGAAIVAVVHDLNLAARHARRIVMINDGSAAADGTPDDVLRADLLSETYGHPVSVIRHPETGGPVVVS